MAEILTMGELIVEIMRPKEDMPLDMAGTFLGPFPSGAPAIFIDTAARLGPVSYTHLDVYKRQIPLCGISRNDGFHPYNA